MRPPGTKLEHRQSVINAINEQKIIIKEKIMTKIKGKPELVLDGVNGNAYAILAEARKVGRKAGWSKEEVDKFLEEAKLGDYDNLLFTCAKYFEVR